VNREVSRRSDVVGIFPNDEALIRLVGALMLETDDERAVTRRYMILETLSRVTDNRQAARHGDRINIGPLRGTALLQHPVGHFCGSISERSRVQGATAFITAGEFSRRISFFFVA
jgi:hypothetical protein